MVGNIGLVLPGVEESTAITPTRSRRIMRKKLAYSAIIPPEHGGFYESAHGPLFSSIFQGKIDR
jgi:hypothetical protein